MKQTNLFTILHTLGQLIIVQGFLLLIPLITIFIFKESGLFFIFLLPSIFCFFSGFILFKIFKPGNIYFLQSLLICGVSWIVLCFMACLPFYLEGSLSFIDAYFETVSGFTTTGITVIKNIEVFPKSLLFWRSFIQWLGGLGILTLFLAVTFKSNNAYFHLFFAESHKISSTRPTPNIKKTIIILWLIYLSFTLLEAIVLRILGMNFFDAVCHSLTTLSTGGFSTYNASIGHFKLAGYENYIAIEYVIIFFMFLGGVNFIIHYLVLTGRIRTAISDPEFRAFVLILSISVLFILINRYFIYSENVLIDIENNIRTSLFTVVSIATTTGYGTTDINDIFFPALARQIFLVLMLIGGSVGSTAGGVKVIRVVILYRLFKQQIKRLRLPRNAMSGLVVENQIFPNFEIQRITGLFFGWIFLLFIGGIITSLFTNLNGWQSFSGMFSAVGNIGPCFFSVTEMAELPVVVKITYIFGMFAGRLEILPILLLFSPRAWRN